MRSESFRTNRRTWKSETFFAVLRKRLKIYWEGSIRNLLWLCLGIRPKFVRNNWENYETPHLTQPDSGKGYRKGTDWIRRTHKIRDFRYEKWKLFIGSTSDLVLCHRFEWPPYWYYLSERIRKYQEIFCFNCFLFFIVFVLVLFLCAYRAFLLFIIYLYQNTHTHTHIYIKLCYRNTYNMFRCFCTIFRELWYCVC